MRWGFTPLQRTSLCILKPQLTGQEDESRILQYFGTCKFAACILHDQSSSYCGSWCADIMCIVSPGIWFESCTDEWAMKFRELILYEFKLGHDTIEAIKNICCAKNKGTIDYSIVTKWFKKFYLGYKYLDDQAMSSRPKTVQSVVVL